MALYLRLRLLYSEYLVEDSNMFVINMVAMTIPKIDLRRFYKPCVSPFVITNGQT